MSPQLSCTHRCQCGAQLECGDPDRCPIGSRVWLCEACELDAIDFYLELIQPADQPEPQPQRTVTHEKH